MNWLEFIFSDKPGHRIRRHVVFWLLWWIYFAATYYYYVQVGLQRISFGNLSSILFLNTFLLIIVHIFSCYFFIYFLLPRYLFIPKYLSFVGGTILLTAALLISGYVLHAFVFPYTDHSYQYDLLAKNTNLWWTSINSVLLTAPKIIAAATAIRLVKRWYLKQQEKEKIEKEILITDLKLLKAQIRPDFLFSSLEHIYKYAKIKSPMSQKLLLKFSDLLSYLLYECDDARVLLEKEITMMKEYMAMEEVRFSHKLEMEIGIKGDLGNKTIAPLILLPFIENSFRQCNGDSEQCWINLELSIEDDVLIMKLMNGAGMDEIMNETVSDEILNAKKRLQLLYPGEYELKMFTEHEICMTLLKISLNGKPYFKPAMPSISYNENNSISNYAIS